MNRKPSAQRPTTTDTSLPAQSPTVPPDQPIPSATKQKPKTPAGKPVDVDRNTAMHRAAKLEATKYLIRSSSDDDDDDDEPAWETDADGDVVMTDAPDMEYALLLVEYIKQLVPEKLEK
nr:uncharacterized protein CTRU02_04649 [Colletotrichum truncatum]KAF6795086.1 hypothetical protein CTRU02_04649 [Colletotrichum truncatum]